ncbi:MAG: FHIPEP family type III secretion protein [Pseudomonadota bacterium]
MRKDLMLIALLVAILTLMVVPLNQGIIDTLIALNISLSVLLLLVAIYLRHPSDFSTFPAVILIGTAFRLALSVGTTRLILSEADAGQIIDTFGEFVVAGSIVIGLVIFLIITVVQFLVVTKGAERVAEVAARFALDAMPGKQMAIDAEMRAGNIDAEEASRQRRRLDRDSQFFGAMDGAMKFVKGDAIAGLIIICINLIGGVAVGMSLHGFGFGEAIRVFSLLTVGDGLVAQIPALLMALCAGAVVTRVANVENDDLGSDIAKELVSDPRVPMVASAIVLLIGFVPGFPTMIFAVGAALLLAISLALRARLRALEAEAQMADEASAAADAAAEAGPTTYPVSKRVGLLLGQEIGTRAVPSAVADALVPMFERLRDARGSTFPRPDIRIDPGLAPDAVVLVLDEVPIFRTAFDGDRILVAGGTDVAAALSDEGDPAELLDWPGLHVVATSAAKADRLSDLAADELPLVEVLAELAFRLCERNLGALFDTPLFEAFLVEAAAQEPKIAEAVVSALPRQKLMQALRALVEDGVPLRPAGVLVAGLDHLLTTRPDCHADALCEGLRSVMKRQLCHRIAGADGILGVALLDPAVEKTLRQSVSEAQKLPDVSAAEGFVMKASTSDGLLGRFRNLVSQDVEPGRHIVVVTAADLRKRLRTWLAANDIHLPVLAAHEIARDVRTVPLDLIRMPAAPVVRPIRRQQRAGVGAYKSVAMPQMD